MSARVKLAVKLPAAVFALALVALSGTADADILKRRAAPAKVSPSEVTVLEIQRALDEARLHDAGRMLDEAQVAGMTDPRLVIASGQLSLKRGRYDAALGAFKAAAVTPAVRAQALEGQGLALASLQRSEEALPVLQEAVAADAKAWRAWNALGGEWDRRQEWSRAETAYGRALELTNGSAQVLNNRGYSLLLQGKTDQAVADFVAALRKDPSLTASRTNLRLALAMRGEYDEALAGVASESRPAALNNAGFAAMMRGEYDKAIGYFEQAMKTKGEYYARASANLQVARTLKAQAERTPAK